MATKTFSDEQLAKRWAETKKNGGTRRDVVLGIMTDIGVSNTGDNYRKVYNNVTQRVKNLGVSAGVTFPELTKGKKGARKGETEVANIKAILATATEPEAPADKETEQAAA